jgi:hypothetical protein
MSDFGTGVKPRFVPLNNWEEGRYFTKEELNLTPVQWGLMTDNVFKASATTDKILPSGAYDIGQDEKDGKPIFTKKDVIHDNLIPLQGLPTLISKEIKEFWTKERLFNELGFLHRRGYLLYGSHGTGKSSLVHEIIDKVIGDGGIVFYCGKPEFFNEGLKVFRQVEPKRKVVCVFEDIDAIIAKYGESVILSILDGENQISGVCNLATTNYPELLDKRIVGRPRRFDRVYKISNLDKSARVAYLKKKLPKEAQLIEWVDATDGLSIAQISETIISVFCFDKTLEDAVSIVTELAQKKSSSTEGKLGFDKDEDED